MASILQNPEPFLLSIKVSWCICLVSHALTLHTRLCDASLDQFPFIRKLPFWRLLSCFLLLGQGLFLLFSSLLSFLRAHLPPWFYRIWMTPKSVSWIFTPSLLNPDFFIQSLLNKVTWKSTRHVARNEIMIVTFQNNFLHLSKGTTTHPVQTVHLEVIHSPSLLVSIVLISSHSSFSYTQNLVSYLHLNDTSLLPWHIPPTWQ